MKNQKGEIATLLTLLSVGLMAVGIFAGNKLAQTGGRLNPQAVEADKCTTDWDKGPAWNWDKAFSDASGDLNQTCANLGATLCTENNNRLCICNKWTREWGCKASQPSTTGNIKGTVTFSNSSGKKYKWLDVCAENVEKDRDPDGCDAYFFSENPTEGTYSYSFDTWKDGAVMKIGQKVKIIASINNGADVKPIDFISDPPNTWTQAEIRANGKSVTIPGEVNFTINVPGTAPAATVTPTSAPGQPTKPPPTTPPGAPTAPPAGGGACALIPASGDYGSTCPAEAQGKCWQRTRNNEGKTCSTDPGSGKYDKDCNKWFKCDGVWKGPCDSQALCEQGAAPTVKPTAKPGSGGPTSPAGGGTTGPTVIPVTPPTSASNYGYIVVKNSFQTTQQLTNIPVSLENIQTMEGTPLSSIQVINNTSFAQNPVLNGKWQYTINTDNKELPIVLRLNITVNPNTKLKATSKIVFPNTYSIVSAVISNIPVCFPQDMTAKPSPTPFLSTNEAALYIYETCKLQGRVYTDNPPIDLDSLKPNSTPGPTGPTAPPAPTGPVNNGYYLFQVILKDNTRTLLPSQLIPDFDLDKDLKEVYVCTDQYCRNSSLLKSGEYTVIGNKSSPWLQNYDVAVGQPNEYYHKYPTFIIKVNKIDPSISKLLPNIAVRIIDSSSQEKQLQVRNNDDRITPCTPFQVNGTPVPPPTNSTEEINQVATKCKDLISTRILQLDSLTPAPTTAPTGPTVQPTAAGGSTPVPPTPGPKSIITAKSIKFNISQKNYQGVYAIEPLLAGVSYHVAGSNSPWVSLTTKGFSSLEPIFPTPIQFSVYTADLKPVQDDYLELVAWARAKVTDPTQNNVNVCIKSDWISTKINKNIAQGSLTVDEINFNPGWIAGINNKWINTWSPTCDSMSIPVVEQSALTGSTNDKYRLVQDLYAKGRISALAVSQFIQQVKRTPGPQFREGDPFLPASDPNSLYYIPDVAT